MTSAPMADLASKVVLVTGGLGGIGRSTARLLAEAGVHVVVTDLIDDGGAGLAAELSALGPRAVFRQADLTDEGQVEELVKHVIDDFGHLDGAFNNAGITQSEKPVFELTSAEFDLVMRVNVLGTFHCVKQEMLAMGSGGSIVITSSALGATAFPDRAGYVTSKHALSGLTRAAAVDGAPLGIRVNAVLPGSTRTPMAEAFFGSMDAAADRRAGTVHLLPRLAEPDEIGRAARWLLSDEASFVTGALLPVEGGATAGRRF
ncbi:SDR family NAD(P)-dependent oxidoreductase [Aeromicrobium alkaliterrae]|uniref:SDR family oxidoreductase n=1 Tax=Aeromicrobium alkaliterrae TaxID=302168 RepID=A0ABN2K7M6_9ACTN